MYMYALMVKYVTPSCDPSCLRAITPLENPINTVLSSGIIYSPMSSLKWAESESWS